MNKHLEQVSRVTRDCVGFTWKIEKFSSLQRQTGEFVRSSVVKCYDAQFCLKLYPNGKIKPNYIDVILEKVDNHSLPSGEYEIAFKDRFGQKRTSFPYAVGTCSSNKNNIQSSTAPSSSLDESHAVVTTNESSMNAETRSRFTSATATTSITSSFLCSSTTDSICTFGNTLASTSTFPVSIPAITFPSSMCGKTSASTSTFAFTTPVTTDSSSTFGKVSASTSIFPNSILATTTTSSNFPSAISLSNTAASTNTSFFSNSLTPSISSTNESTSVSSSGFFSFPIPVNSKASSVESVKDTKAQITKATSSGSLPTTASPSSGPTSKVHSIQSMMPFCASISTKSPSLCFLEKTSFDSTMNPLGPSFFLETDQGMSLPRDLLFKFREDLFPDDVLTVLCEVKFVSVVNVSELTVDEDICSINGAKLLIEDLQAAFENPQFSDVTLKVGEVDFPAHKVILASRSKVFHLMFDSEMKESRENVVNLVEMKPATANEMLRYIYTGKVQDLSMDKAADLYVVADRYDLPELKQWCKNFMLRQISSVSVCNVAVLAHLHGDEDLEKASKRTIRNNLKPTLSSEEWLSLSKENPTWYLEVLQAALLDDSL